VARRTFLFDTRELQGGGDNEVFAEVRQPFAQSFGDGGSGAGFGVLGGNVVARSAPCFSDLPQQVV
jgi:hypothetical protein